MTLLSTGAGSQVDRTFTRGPELEILPATADA